MNASVSRAVDASFGGRVAPWVYVVLRVGLAGTLLVRQSDVLSPFVALEHHEWVHGLDFAWSVAKEPALSSPLVAGFSLGQGATQILVWGRTVLAALLLAGVGVRWSAALLAACCYTLLVSDRYHYLHHLHLLYFAIAWLAFAPRAPRAVPRVPVWPLQLLRAVVLSVYLAAGVAKLDATWLSGDTLEVLHRLHQLDGPLWSWAHGHIGSQGVAWMVCATELALPMFLMLRMTRRAAVVAGWAFHGAVSAVMPVSTFGWEMALLLVAFLPDSTVGNPGPASAHAMRAAAT